MFKRALIVALLVIVVIAGCVKDKQSTDPSPNPNNNTFKARFVPQGGILPFPNDLFFNASTDDTLNIPVGTMHGPNEPGSPLAAINTLDGFSTLAPIDVYFTDSIDPATLIGGRTVFVFNVEVNPKTKAVTAIKRALKAGTDYTLGLSPNLLSTNSAANAPGGVATHSVVTITPRAPLQPASAYLVVVTNGIKDTSGQAAQPDTDYADIKQAELPVLGGGSEAKLAKPGLAATAKFTLAQLAAAAGAGIDPRSIVLTFSFSTQSEGDVLTAIEQQTATGSGVLAATGLTTQDVLPNGAGKGLADILAGDVTLPYYLNTDKPLTGFWHGANGTDLTRRNPQPVASAKVTIPALAAIPDPRTSGCSKPAIGWPIVIFQHGITRNREDMFAIADAFASACFAVIAIDQPLHGVTDTSDPFYRNQLLAGTPAAQLMTGERTFDLDVQNNTTGAAQPDGKIDASGAHYVNLQHLLTSRDNLRESAADLINLTKLVPAIHLLGKKAQEFDASRIYFIGHSLGAMVGATYLGIDPSAASATLASPGGDVTQLLRNSPTLSPPIKAGLQAQGLTPGTQAYENFFRNAQTVIDSGDPANYAAAAAAKHPILLTEIVGGAGSPPDQVIPNAATQLLARVMGLTSITHTTSKPGGVDGIVRFIAGDHSSLLDPGADPAVTTEMQSEAIKFSASNGTTIAISNPSVIKQ